jgi:hypothetical protein
MSFLTSELPGSFRWLAILCAGVLLTGCSLKNVRKLEASPQVRRDLASGDAGRQAIERHPSETLEVTDLSRIPQAFGALAAAAGPRLNIPEECRDQLQVEFRARFFAPWSASAPSPDAAELRDFMRQEGRVNWYGPNQRKVAPSRLQELVANCALDSFPSRNDTAISVAPGHLRGLPTQLPFYQSADSFPFDMLSYPQVKLNEPLRVLHASRDGVWLFVQTAYTAGWLERRDVALVDGDFIDRWMQAPHLVVVQDYAPVGDGLGVAVYPSKIGTILPLARAGEHVWEVVVASAGEGGRVQSRIVTIPRATAAPFPLVFNPSNVALVGDQLLGEPYGWGEIYGLRDCSAMLRDFFIPFGIWVPRTSADQISSVPKRIELARMTPAEKEEVIKRQGIPFLSLFYKPGHIMLYVGEGSDGKPLVFHDAWSVRLGERAPQEGAGSREGCKEGCAAKDQEERALIIGVSAITTLAPGKELGLFPGGSLLERGTELGVITERCPAPTRPGPMQTR